MGDLHGADRATGRRKVELTLCYKPFACRAPIEERIATGFFFVHEHMTLFDTPLCMMRASDRGCALTSRFSRPPGPDALYDGFGAVLFCGHDLRLVLVGQRIDRRIRWHLEFDNVRSHQ